MTCLVLVAAVMMSYYTDNRDKNGTFLQWVKSRAMDLVHCSSYGRHSFSPEADTKCKSANEVERSLLSVECMLEACVLVKR